MSGLILACFGSVFNVLTDVSRKKVLDRQFNTAVIGMWCKAIAIFFYCLALLILLIAGAKIQLPALATSGHLSPRASFFLYLSINALLEGCAILLNYRALQVSQLSFCIPFMALTPVFLLPIGKFFLHEQISGGMVIGVGLVMTGSLVINRRMVSQGWLEPAKAIVREKGSRYMLLVSLLLATTAALDKWFITSGGQTDLSTRLSKSFCLSIGKATMLTLFFAGLAIVRRRKSFLATNGNVKELWLAAWKMVPAWLVLAGFFEAIVIVLQLLALQYAAAAIVISIKRSGILLACGLGWLFFKERDIMDRVIGSCVMIVGVVVFFLTKPGSQGLSLVSSTGALGVALLALIGMSLALWITRNRTINHTGIIAANELSKA